MKAKILISAISIFTMSSCAVSISSVDTSCGNYLAPEFASNGIEKNQVVILPILGVSETESLRKPISDELTISLSNKFNDSEKKVVGTRELIGMLNDNGGASQYADAIRDYRLSGILPKEYLNSIYESTDSKYALYSRIELDDLKGEVSLVSEVIVKAQIWDLENADVVWEGQGGYAYIKSSSGFVIVDETQSSEKSIIRNVTDGLSGVIGTSNRDCKDKQVLVTEAQKAYTNAYIGAALGATVGGALIGLIPSLFY
jgi:hypothetical protein